MFPIVLLLLALGLGKAFAAAELEEGDAVLPYNYTSGPYRPRPWTPQFENWYPGSDENLARVSNGICNLTLRDYREAYAAPPASELGSKLNGICRRHQNCVLSRMSGGHQADQSSATVVLGLIPTFLALLGPTVAEVSLLSAHRPVLAMLVVLGGPTFQVITRLFDYTDPADVLRADARRLRLPVLNRRNAILISIAEYIAVFGACATTLYTCIEIGERTILAWGCTVQFGPLIWALMAIVPQLMLATGYAIRTRNKDDDVGAHRSSKNAGTLESRSRLLGNPRDSNNHVHRISGFKDRLIRLGGSLWKSMQREATICARQGLDTRVIQDVPRWIVFLNLAAEGMAYSLWAFGTAVFSSLLFLTVTNVFQDVLWRFVLAAVLCRMVTIIELAGLRASIEA